MRSATQVVEVFGQKKLLKWSIPGAAHFFVFWAFLILGTVYLEAYGALFTRELAWHFLVFGTFKPLGFLQDFIAVMALFGLLAFWQIRMKNSPAKLGRKSRFSGSHLGGACLVLFMIFNVIWTLFLFRGAVAAHEIAEGEDGYGKAAFVSHALGTVLPDSSDADRHRPVAAHRHHAGLPGRRRATPSTCTSSSPRSMCCSRAAPRRSAPSSR